MAVEDPQREMTLGEQLQEHITRSDKQINYLGKTTEPKAKPPVVQEIVLARRHLEDANARLKRAYNLLDESEK
jgi:hypothetical protein